MRTVGEIDRAGNILRIYHQTEAGSSWTHPPGERYRYRAELGPERRRAEGKYGWVEMACPCPLGTQPEGHAGASEGDERANGPQGPPGPLSPPEAPSGGDPRDET